MYCSFPALYTDHYELTMVAAALRSGVAERRAVFEVFTRSLPAGRAYGIVAGIDRVLDAVRRFHFTSTVVDHLTKMGIAKDPDVADWLSSYRFKGDIIGYPDGELFFPRSPILTVEGEFAECVVLETVVLSILNHDCAVASAAARMRSAAGNRIILEGGSRRTDPEAAVAAAKAAYIGGFDATSNLEAGRRWNIPTGGTASHAFVLAHNNECDAFTAQRNTLGEDSTYLVDTLDVDKAIHKAVEVVGSDIGAIRIDSGNLYNRSVEARALLDKLGASKCRIVVSGDLDEFKIAELEKKKAPVNAYLVGTNLVTGSGHPTASMVYKLVAISDCDDNKNSNPNSSMRSVGKLSAEKATIGGRKQALRTIDTDGFLLSETLQPANFEQPDSSYTEEGEASDFAGSIPANFEQPNSSYTPQVLMVSKGKVVYTSNTEAARQLCAKRLKTLQRCDRLVNPLNTPAVPTLWAGWDNEPNLENHDR